MGSGMDESGREVIPPDDPKADTGVKFVYANGVEMFHGGASGCTFGRHRRQTLHRSQVDFEPESIVKEPLR